MKKKIEKFEDLEVWKMSMQLAESFFKSLKNHPFQSSLRSNPKSALSIPSNIAEAFERKSNKEFIRFLSIPRSSCAELRTQVYLPQSISLIEHKLTKEWIETARSISAMISRLIQVRKERFS